MQVHSLVKPACLEASSPRDVASVTQSSNRQMETTTEMPRRFLVSRRPKPARVDPTPTSAVEGCIAFALLNDSPESTLNSSRNLQSG